MENRCFGEILMCTNQMKISDEIEIEPAEFEDASKASGAYYNSHAEATTQVNIPSESDMEENMLESHYALEKILKEKKQIE